MRTNLFCLTTCLALLTTGTLLAHGPKLDYQANQIVIHADSTLGGLPLYEDDFAFNFVNLGWGALPISQGGGHLVPGDTISLTVHDWSPLLPTASPLPTYLLYHTGVNFADAGSASLSFLSAGVGLTAHSKSFDSIAIGDVFGPDDFHNHLGVLLGNGAPGVYALLIANQTSNRGVAPSENYLLVLNNNAGPTEYAKAVADIEKIVSVPELSSSILAGGMTLVALATGIRRRRKV